MTTDELHAAMDAAGRRNVDCPIHKLWPWLPMEGICLFGHIFVKDKADVLTITHEQVHARQQKERPLMFWLSYIFWPPARARYEAEAYAVQANAGCPVDGDQGLAAMLSGMMYLWCCSRAKAAELIESYR